MNTQWLVFEARFVTALQLAIFQRSCSYLVQLLASVGAWNLLIIGSLLTYLAAHCMISCSCNLLLALGRSRVAVLGTDFIWLYSSVIQHSTVARTLPTPVQCVPAVCYPKLCAAKGRTPKKFWRPAHPSTASSAQVSIYSKDIQLNNNTISLLLLWAHLKLLSIRVHFKKFKKNICIIFHFSKLKGR